MKTKSYFLSLVLIFLIVNLPIFACKQAWDLSSDTIHKIASIANRAYDDTYYVDNGAEVPDVPETFVGHRWNKYPFRGRVGHRYSEHLLKGYLGWIGTEEGTENTIGAVSYAPDFGTVVSLHGSRPGVGSNWRDDWITDFNVELVSAADHGYPGLPGRIHRGFALTASSYFDAMSGLMNRVFAENPAARTQDIYFTGHSLGAALAKLTALRYSITNRSDVPNQIKVIAFSSPNIGDKDFVEHVEEYRLSKANALNFCAETDIVPSIPPKFLCGYKRGIGHYIPIHALEISEHKITDLLGGLTGRSYLDRMFAAIEVGVGVGGVVKGDLDSLIKVFSLAHGLYPELILTAFKDFQVQMRSDGSAAPAPIVSVKRPIFRLFGWFVS